MKWRRPKRRVRADPSRLRLWPIGWALAACFAAALVGLACLTWLSLVLLRFPKLPRSSTVSLHDFVGVLQLVFASVAGAGALVALVMAYRRQRVAETATAHDRMRVLNERFTAIAGQLGDEHAAVRLAGVHAMAGLADDWEENRQTSSVDTAGWRDGPAGHRAIRGGPMKTSAFEARMQTCPSWWRRAA
jgi:uncharacterized membrane protein